MDRTHVRCRSWIQDAFTPLAMVLATEQAKELCAKNNLTFCDMLACVACCCYRACAVGGGGANHFL